MDNLTLNPGARFPAPEEELASLPLHVLSVATQECIYCGAGESYRSHEEYLADYASSFEGEFLSGPYDPWDRAYFEYVVHTCSMADTSGD